MHPNKRLAIAAGVLAAGMAVWSVTSFIGSDDVTVTCNGKKSDGYSCAQYSNGRVSMISFNDLKAKQQQQKRGGAYITGILGALFGGAAVLLVVSARRQASREQKSAASWAEPAA